MRRIYILFMAIFFAFYLQAQLPAFEIYLMYIGGDEISGYTYSEPFNITNQRGYDNQPYFAADGKNILFSSIRDDRQADIYTYSIQSNSVKQITNTIESEFSPEITGDGKYITVVRIERDSSQRMWTIKMKNKKAKVLMPDIYNVGYYSRIDENNIALFVLPEPFNLLLANVTEQKAIPIDSNIGRCIKMIPFENAFSYLTKNDSLSWEINKYSISSKTTSMVCKVPAAGEDFAWRIDGNLFMANGTSVYYYDYNQDNKWYLLDDMSKFGIGNIYRLAFSTDGKWMAIVAEENN